jgi:hypothetical protein
MKFHTFRGKRYRIKKVRRGRDYLGICDDPKDHYKVLEAPIDGKSCNDLDTIIHESLHACLFDIDDAVIDASATSIAKFLWRLSWRKLK